MKKVLGICLCVVGLASSVAAQTATPASKLAWDMVGESPAVAQGANYNLYVDGAGTAINISSATCVVQTGAPANATCTIPFPAMTPGAHILTMTQVMSGLESNKSVPLNVTFVVIVTPTGLRIAP